MEEVSCGWPRTLQVSSSGWRASPLGQLLASLAYPSPQTHVYGRWASYGPGDRNRGQEAQRQKAQGP